ncbi:MAG: DUF4143 domain-containing protein [Pseudonocardia sp.]|nr:DUF4143 domain-containing protein [Pseudonocardia sp.]
MRQRYRPRLIDDLLAGVVAEFPATLVTGPRAAGKTTTAVRHAASEIRLDRPGVAVTVAADPDAALRGLAEPVLIDEWQMVPTVLGAVKRAVDDDPRPGRFIVTGSVHASLDHQTWPGTGRLIHIDMYGMTRREIAGGDLTRPPFLSRVAADVGSLSLPEQVPDLRDYVSLALRGGFPQAVSASSIEFGLRWSASYLRELFTRDVAELEPRRDPQRLRRYFEVLAASSAGVVLDRTLYDVAEVDRRTATAYERLLQDLYVLDLLPAWHSNRLKRLARLPKRHVVDPGLVAAALDLDVEAVMRDGYLVGRMLDTFVVSQFRPELTLTGRPPVLHHLRDQNGAREIDLIAELGGGRVIAMEIKATSAPRPADARHLAWFRDEMGERFVCGLVLHTGPGIFPLGDRIVAAPIASIWG